MEGYMFLYCVVALLALALVVALLVVYYLKYSTKPNKRKILCFGDSLTAGFMDGGSEYWPYANKLQRLLDNKYGRIYEVVCRGYPGDTVINDFEFKFRRDIESSFLAVLLLGGTNDLAYGRSTDEIAHVLDTLCMEAEEIGAKVFVLAVPDCKHGISRKDLNNKLKIVAQKNRVFVNINDALPPTEESLWNDGLHCSKVGYDKMADTIFLELADFLNKI